MLACPEEINFLGYCYETENQEHTHMLLELKEPRSKAYLIRELSLFLEQDCCLQVDSHKNFGSIIGYHIGFGDKARCTTLCVIFPSDFSVDEYIKKRVAHKARGLKETAAQTALVLSKTTKEAALEGIINWKEFDKHARAREIWRKFQDDEREDIPESLPAFDGQSWRWDEDVKKTHLWIWSKQSDRGKTTWARELFSRFKYIWKDDFTWWNDVDDESIQGIIMDDYEGKLAADKLKRLADGFVDLNNKFGGLTKLNRKLHLIILSNYPISYCYPKHYENLYARFIEYNCDL